MPNRHRGVNALPHLGMRNDNGNGVVGRDLHPTCEERFVTFRRQSSGAVERAEGRKRIADGKAATREEATDDEPAT